VNSKFKFIVKMHVKIFTGIPTRNDIFFMVDPQICLDIEFKCIVITTDLNRLIVITET